MKFIANNIDIHCIIICGTLQSANSVALSLIYNIMDVLHAIRSIILDNTIYQSSAYDRANFYLSLNCVTVIHCQHSGLYRSDLPILKIIELPRQYDNVTTIVYIIIKIQRILGSKQV